METEPRTCNWLDMDGILCGGELSADELAAGELFHTWHPGPVPTVPQYPQRIVHPDGSTTLVLGDERGATVHEQGGAPGTPGLATGGIITRSEYLERPEPAIEPAVMDDAEPIGPLEAAHLEALASIGRHTKPDGLLVLNLARRLDRGEAGTAHAAMAGRLMAAAQAAYAGAPPDPSALDELRARRDARISALRDQA